MSDVTLNAAIGSAAEGPQSSLLLVDLIHNDLYPSLPRSG